MANISSFFGFGNTTSFADMCYLIGAFGNCCVIETDNGLIVFDIAHEQFGQLVFDQLRSFTDKPIKYLIYSHGHFDHCFGFIPFVEEIEKNGWDMPQIIAHENILNRWEKYKMLEGYHRWLNHQQFASVIGDGSSFQLSAHGTLNPTITVQEQYSFELGGWNFELFHDKGETNDALWLWFPGKKVIFTGDLIISGYPNIGNPYKVQRFPKHWALAMERMALKKADFLAPGHGPLIEGKRKVSDVLSITAEAMHFVHDEVVKRMNQGKWFEQIYHEMMEIYPDKFKNHDYLQYIYGCYPFAIHAAYRLYHGWYDSGNPTDLFPAKSYAIAREFLKLNSAEAYVEHARKLFSQGNKQLALHILDPVVKGGNPVKIPEILLEAMQLKIAILEKQTECESSFIASNIITNEVIRLKTKISELKNQISSKE
ncbi:MAG: MBL fold metallo-hydrolase [Candidatus Hermodarchaeota archaeon]